MAVTLDVGKEATVRLDWKYKCISQYSDISVWGRQLGSGLMFFWS